MCHNVTNYVTLLLSSTDSNNVFHCLEGMVVMHASLHLCSFILQNTNMDSFLLHIKHLAFLMSISKGFSKSLK